MAINFPIKFLKTPTPRCLFSERGEARATENTRSSLRLAPASIFEGWGSRRTLNRTPALLSSASFAGARRRERSDRSRAEASSFCGVSAAGPLLFFGTPSLVVCVVLHGLLAQILSHGHATDIGRACAGPLPCLSPERGGGSAATGAERRRAPFAAMLSSGF